MIPIAAKLQLLDLVDAGHQGMVAIKAAARGYVWWPGVNKCIEAKAKSCSICQGHKRAQPKAPSPEWQRPSRAWDTLHIDFADPVEVRQMKSINSPLLIQELRSLYGTFGVQRQVVSNNGTSLCQTKLNSSLGIPLFVTLHVPRTIR